MTKFIENIENPDFWPFWAHFANLWANKFS